MTETATTVQAITALQEFAQTRWKHARGCPANPSLPTLLFHPVPGICNCGQHGALAAVTHLRRALLDSMAPEGKPRFTVDEILALLMQGHGLNISLSWDGDAIQQKLLGR